MPDNLEHIEVEETEITEQPLELRSEAIQELISNDPSWMVRWGITLFFAMLIMLLAIAWIVKYPDTVNAPLKITTIDAPKSIQSKIGGKLIKLFVQPNDSVHTNDALAYMESTASHEQVLLLSKDMDTISSMIQSGKVESISHYIKNNYEQLGEVQQAYQNFYNSYLQFKDYLSSGFYLAKKQMLYRDLRNLQQLQSSIQQQKNIYSQDYNLAQEAYKIKQGLAKDKVIAAIELKEEESKLLAKKMPLEQLNANAISNQSLQNDKQKELLELEKQIAEQKNIFLQAASTLSSTIEEWKSKYVLLSPINGRVVFTTSLEEKQTLTPNQELFYIATNNTKYYGEMYVPQENLGKIKTGQRVLIKFAAYPFQEYGSIKGEVASIADVPKDNTYMVRISMPSALVTNYNKKIIYKNGMTALGEIVVKEDRLINKLIFNIKKMLN
jgi:HlyD family secretion protein